ncbi:hypothetical protein FXN61_25125 [Lentzea sp. PSKA42]|uniref:Uncharacterized protein n=1 Tax=Lentzea indica TaxID=2604800 RepID=A0ABX1FM60_9PSEU|nr:hypothetical protein [Lentzea indica]NKE59907.1 hypothetical protein [Lentzea indica]
MSTPNPLVAQAPAEPSGFFNAGTGDNGWATGFSIADSAVDAYKGISEGNWIEGASACSASRPTRPRWRSTRSARCCRPRRRS